MYCTTIIALRIKSGLNENFIIVTENLSLYFAFSFNTVSIILCMECKMAKRKDLKKILIIGSGPIVIGQAAEFDYAGTQACLALKEEGYEVVLVNSNPATIMTDTTIDKAVKLITQ